MSRASSIDCLPQDIQDKFYALLQDPRISQLEVTKKINAIIKAEGLDPVSKSAVNRKAIKYKEVGERLRASREAAKIMIADLGSRPAGEVGLLINELIGSMCFRAASAMISEEEIVDPKILKELAITAHRLEQANSANVKTMEEIRRQEREKAAEETGKSLKKAGITEETIKQIRDRIMGI